MPTEGPRASHAYAPSMLAHGQASDELVGVPTPSCCLVRPPLDTWHRARGPEHVLRQANPDHHNALPLPNHWPNELPLPLGLVVGLHSVWLRDVSNDAFVLMDLMFVWQLMDDNYELI